MDPSWMSWGLHLYCPEGTTVPQSCRDNPLYCESLVCWAGGTCPNTYTRIECPAGHYCKHGVDVPTPCGPGWFLTQTAEQRCPPGTGYEPVRHEHIFYLLLVLLPIVALLECCSVVEKKRRGQHTRAYEAHQEEEHEALEHLTLEERRKLPLDERASTRFHVAQALGAAEHNGGRPVYFPSGSSSARSSVAGRARRPTFLPSLVPTAATEIGGRLRRMSSGRLQRLVQQESAQSSQSSRSGISDMVDMAAALDLRASISPPAPPPPMSEASLVSSRREASSSRLTSQRVGTPDVEVGELALGENSGQQSAGRVFLKLGLEDLTFTIGSAQVLVDISLMMRQGELVALMGESGSGKTTLLNILGGRANYGHRTGRMTLNHRPYEPSRMTHLVGYVPQAHLVYKELTVYENLYYASLLRLNGEDSSESYRVALVESALELLGLQKYRHFVCDPALGERLSGGQMRRVGIGVELVCDPPIMLLDEPTSALDAVNTRLVVAALDNLARRGVLVLASLHQPRQTAFDMIDRLILLRKGELIYGGAAEDAPRYFEQLGYSLPANTNPADFFIEVAFGFEVSSKTAYELPMCFGLRYDASRQVLTGLPELHAKRSVRAEALGMLWRQWYRTSMRSVKAIMKILADRASGRRSLAERLLRLKASDLKRMRASLRASLRRERACSSASPPQPIFRLSRASSIQRTPSMQREPVTRGASLSVGAASASAHHHSPPSRCSPSKLDPNPKLARASKEEFVRWFLSDDGFGGSLRAGIAHQAWHRAQAKAEARVKENPSIIERIRQRFDKTGDAFVGMQPSWTQLREAMDKAPMPMGQKRPWAVHFYVCFLRYCYKLLRTRMRIYALCFIIFVLGVICGVLHGAPPARNDLLIYYMIFNTLFATVSATATSSTFGGNIEFFSHEAHTGVSQTAEGFARLLADLMWLALFAPVFAITVRTFAVLRADVLSIWWMTSWAMSPLGYVFAIVAPQNEKVLTASVAVLLCCLTNGLFGLKASLLGNALALSPGYNSYLLLAFGACVAEPLDTTRAFLMRLLREAGMLPRSREEVAAYESGDAPWREHAMRDLFLFGLVVRVAALLLYWLRSNYSLEGFLKHLLSRACAACRIGRSGPSQRVGSAGHPLDAVHSQLAECDPDDEQLGSPRPQAHPSPRPKPPDADSNASTPMGVQLAWLERQIENQVDSSRVSSLDHPCEHQVESQIEHAAVPTPPSATSSAVAHVHKPTPLAPVHAGGFWLPAL